MRLYQWFDTLLSRHPITSYIVSIHGRCLRSLVRRPSVLPLGPIPGRSSPRPHQTSVNKCVAGGKRALPNTSRLYMTLKYMSREHRTASGLNTLCLPCIFFSRCY